MERGDGGERIRKVCTLTWIGLTFQLLMPTCEWPILYLKPVWFTFVPSATKISWIKNTRNHWRIESWNTKCCVLWEGQIFLFCFAWGLVKYLRALRKCSPNTSLRAYWDRDMPLDGQVPRSAELPSTYYILFPWKIIHVQDCSTTSFSLRSFLDLHVFHFNLVSYMILFSPCPSMFKTLFIFPNQIVTITLHMVFFPPILSGSLVFFFFYFLEDT